MGRLLLIFLFSFFLFSKPSLARNLGSATGEISGIIKDSSKNEPLLGVNIILSGTGIGTISDIDGKFLIESVPAGTAKIVITFIGFKTKEYTVEMKEGEKIFLEVKLTPDLLKMGEGVSTQNRGQQAAINTQLNSDALVNAVSSVRIKELPDVDAAEAVGHLSGVSIERESGEASKILLRGLDPKFTNITINGVKVPASSETDRSVDLRIISPELLSGIEVYKSPTADMDGDALAGSVNLLVNKALDKPSANIRIFGGYNDLGDKYGNFKSSAFYSHRFWKKKLGIIITGNYEKTNKICQTLTANYMPYGQTGAGNIADISATNIGLQEQQQQRNRMGANMNLDYSFRNGTIAFFTFFSQTTTNTFAENMLLASDGTANISEHNGYVNSPSNTNLTALNIATLNTLNNSLSGTYKLGPIETDWCLSRVSTDGDIPYSVYLDFEGKGVNPPNLPIHDPRVINDSLIKNNSSLILENMYSTPSKTQQTDYDAYLNARLPFKLTQKIAGFFKVGAKYADVNRDKETDCRAVWDYYLGQSDVNTAVQNYKPYSLALNNSNGILISNFVNGGNLSNSLPLQYNTSLQPLLSQSVMNRFYQDEKGELQTDRTGLINNYSLTEAVNAVYIMGKINYEELISFIPGVRYEYLNGRYTGVYSTTSGELGVQGIQKDSTTHQRYGVLLPSFHLKFKPLNWFDLRLSVAKTYTRPDYYAIIPFTRVDNDVEQIWRGNPNLQHLESWNYDAYITVYHNSFGLISFGAFYKKIKNLFYTVSGVVLTLPEVQAEGYPTGVYTIQSEYRNAPGYSWVKGIELDIQSHLAFLPKPFNGFVISANITALQSQTMAPYVKSWYSPDPRSPFYLPPVLHTIDSTYKSVIPTQIPLMCNLTVGYDIKGFSIRTSLQYTAPSLRYIDISDQDMNKKYTDQYLRLDVSLKQKFKSPWEYVKNISVFLNGNNLTNESNRQYQYKPEFWTSRIYYGRTAELGVQLSF